jgi:starch-binding outer membrane protein SusE/F
MKNIIKFLTLVVCTAVIFAACKKADPLPFYDAGNAPVLSANVTSVAPAPADSNNTVLSLSWTDPAYATDSSTVKYIVQIDSAGQNFNNPYTKEITAALGTSFIAKDLNAVLVGFGFNFGVAYGVDIRIISSYANNNDQKVSNTITLQATPYVVPPKVQIPAARTLYLVGAATAGGWGNPVPTPAQQFTMIDTVTYEGTFYLAGGGQYLMLPVNGSWDEKYAVDDNTVAGLSDGGEFGYYSNTNNTIYNDNFPAPSANGMYKIRVDFQNGKFTVTPEKVFSLLRVAGDYQGWSPATAPALASPNADGVYEGYVNVPSGGSYEFKLTSQADWNGTNYGDAGAGSISGTAPGNLVFPSGGGYYKINANLNSNTWSATATTWGVVGSLTGWGSNPDIPLTYDAGSGSFTSAPVVITGNENFKFRANSDWPINVGDNGRDGSLEQDGADIPITAGTYTFTLYLNNAGYYTYKVIRN